LGDGVEPPLEKVDAAESESLPSPSPPDAPRAVVPEVAGGSELPRLKTELGITLRLIPATRGAVGEPDAEAFYLAEHEVTVAQFEVFVRETGHVTDAEKGNAARRAPPGHEMTWRNPGFPQQRNHPVTHVSCDDATAFCDWLAAAEKREFRLPTAREWEFASRAGTAGRDWADDADYLKASANLADQSYADESNKLKARLPKEIRDRLVITPRNGTPFEWNDEFPKTAAVGSLRPNPFGLYDMHGNVCEWTADVEPANQRPPRPAPPGFPQPQGPLHKVVGGGWTSTSRTFRASRLTNSEDSGADTGFRVAASIDPTQ
jgi:formylglycine-generating enzyme required for sulfatase activity